MSLGLDPNCAHSDHTWRGTSACHCGARLRCGCGQFVREDGLDDHIVACRWVNAQPWWLACYDAVTPTWTCIENDGTGLWCDGCLAFTALRALLNPTRYGSKGPWDTARPQR